MIFNVGDIIDNEYLVIDSLKYNGKEYVYVNFDNDKDTILEVYEENEKYYIRDVEDDKVFEKIMFKFNDSLKRFVSNEN